MRAIGAVVALLLFTAGRAVAAPAPRPRPAHGGLTAEQIAAEMRQRGYHVYEVRRTGEGQWEVTVHLVRKTEEGESVQPITYSVRAGGNDPREVLLAVQALTKT